MSYFGQQKMWIAFMIWTAKKGWIAAQFWTVKDLCLQKLDNKKRKVLFPNQHDNRANIGPYALSRNDLQRANILFKIGQCKGQKFVVPNG